MLLSWSILLYYTKAYLWPNLILLFKEAEAHPEAAKYLLSIVEKELHKEPESDKTEELLEDFTILLDLDEELDTGLGSNKE
jgi:hypothetical protein